MGKLLERLKDPVRSGVYRVERVDEVLDATRGSKLQLARISHAEKSELMKNIAKALEFPDWFGHNWDALEDCLTDLSWREAEGHVLLLEGEADDRLIDVLRSAAEFWAGQGRSFFAVLLDPARRSPLPPLFRDA